MEVQESRRVAINFVNHSYDVEEGKVAPACVEVVQYMCG